MAVRKFAISGRRAALALAMATLALSGAAQARPDDEGGDNGRDRGSQHSDSGYRGGGQPAPAWTPRPAPQPDTGGQARGWGGGQPNTGGQARGWGGGQPDTGGQTRGWGGGQPNTGGQNHGWGGSRSGGGWQV